MRKYVYLESCVGGGGENGRRDGETAGAEKRGNVQPSKKIANRWRRFDVRYRDWLELSEARGKSNPMKQFWRLGVLYKKF